MLDLMTGVRKIREHIPVREAVSKVMKDRREFVGGRPLRSHFGVLTPSDYTLGAGWYPSGIVRLRLALRL